MPTPKQVRYHFGRIARLRHRLQCALNAAHDAGVIEYEPSKYDEESPCSTLYETWNRIKRTTEKKLAQAMRDEIAGKKKDFY